MSSAGKQHPVETIVEWLAPVPLALAVGWAGKLAGIPAAGLAAVAVLTLIAGFAAIRLTGGNPGVTAFRFEPPAFEAVMPELLLEAKDELLELDDPLDEVEPESRVVRLFAKPEPTPGEMVDRIADFLGERRRPPSASDAVQGASPPADASAALHAALANIRASLR